MNTTAKTQKCAFCDAPAVPSDTTDPPCCARHADLLILTEWMRDQGETITPDSVAAHVTRARAAEAATLGTQATSGFWTITPGEVAGMLPAIVEVKNGVKI